MFLFDVSKQSGKLKYSVTDIQIKAHFDNNVNAGTEAYAVIISDRLIKFQSDGYKMFFSYIKMVNTKELKTTLKENKIHFYSYWDEKQLIDLAINHGFLAEEAPKKEKSKDPKFNRLKTIMHNPRKVSLEDVEMGEIKTFPSIYKAGKFIDQSPQTIVYWDGKV